MTQRACFALLASLLSSTAWSQVPDPTLPFNQRPSAPKATGGPFKESVPSIDPLFHAVCVTPASSCRITDASPIPPGTVCSCGDAAGQTQ